MSKTIWLRVKLPEKDLSVLRSDFPGCEIITETDDAIRTERLQRLDAVFTEEVLPDSLVQQMPNLQWLHVTRRGVNAYLTPTIKERPIQVTGSKGIHGTVFSEFALACIFMLAKKLPECIEAQKQKMWQKLAPFEIEGKTIGIVGLGTVGLELARKAKALGMRVLATKRTVKDVNSEKEQLAEENAQLRAQLSHEPYPSEGAPTRTTYASGAGKHVRERD